jgi:hypothetical protein
MEHIRDESLVQPEDIRRAQVKAKANPRPVAPLLRHAPWTSLLEQRKLIEAPMSVDDATQYNAAVSAERRTVGRTFFGIRHAQGPPQHIGIDNYDADAPRHPKRRRINIKSSHEPDLPHEPCDVASNDTGLPGIDSDIDPDAKSLEQWCKTGSWKMCETCHSLHPQRLLPGDMLRAGPTKVTAKSCNNCRSGTTVPQPAHVPKTLRNLPLNVLDALRPLDICTGVEKYAMHGYRIKTGMINFSWAEQDVNDKIDNLPRGHLRKIARNAFKALMQSADSAYSRFIRMHRRFLADHFGPSEIDRRRPLRFIEEIGIECALWPHLYWSSKLCETYIRSMDDRHVHRQQDDQMEWEDASEQDDDQDDAAHDERVGRTSIRKNFMMKVFSPVVGYSGDFEFLQFVYDLSLWTGVGGKKNKTGAYGVPFHLAMKGSSFTPMYWHVRHLGVLDLQRQCGNPSFFLTQSVYEKSFPYHEWVLAEMRMQGRLRQGLAGPEALHHALVLTQFHEGYITGSNCKQGRSHKQPWTQHLFACADGSGQRTYNAHFFRLEFQDGKRKRPSASDPYRGPTEGRGTVHSHAIAYCENIGSMSMEQRVSATLPPLETDPVLHGYVKHAQYDWNGVSGWPVELDHEGHDPLTGKLSLLHTNEDHAKGLRAYVKPIMRALGGCHQDLLHTDGRGNLLSYCSGYTPKFSGSFQEEFLNDEASDFSIARKICCDYHPLEPEMWLYLAGAQFKPCRYGGTLVEKIAPLPDMPEPPQWVLVYENCQWRKDDMTLIDFLRKSNFAGDIVQWVRRLHVQTYGVIRRGAPRDPNIPSLQAFANTCPMRGEKSSPWTRTAGRTMISSASGYQCTCRSGTSPN